MTIRVEGRQDFDPITEVHDQAFKGKLEGEIVEQLRSKGKLLISLVYEEDGKIVGHIAYSPITYKSQTIGIGLGPVAVLPAYQRQGIGSKLILEGNAIAFSKGFENIFVLGEPAYYRRFGFELAKASNFYCKYDPKGEHFMVMSRGGELPQQKIVVEYHKAFDQ